jgi:acetyl esterase/lipase
VAKNLVNDKILSSLELQNMGVAYAGKEPLNHPLISPLHASLKGLPPLLIQVSDGEVLYSDALRLQEKAQKAKVKVELQVWKDLIHWWHLFWHIMPEANEAIEGISNFIKVQMRLEGKEASSL